MDTIAYLQTRLGNGLVVLTRRIIRRRGPEVYATAVGREGTPMLPFELHYNEDGAEAMRSHDELCRRWQDWEEFPCAR